MGAWTTADLLTAVKADAMSPSNQATLTDANILAFATDEMLSFMVPAILGVKGGYFETVQDTTIVAGQASYSIPSRAIGGKLSNISVVDSQGVETNVPVVEYNEDAAKMGGLVGYSYTVAYVRNYKVTLVPVPTGVTTLRMVYYARPGDLVLTTSAMQVATVGGSSLVLDSALSGLTTGVPFDIIQNNPGFTFLGIDQTATVASATLTFTPPSGVAVDDWVALAGQSPIPQIPYELHPVLRIRTTARVMNALGDQRAYELKMNQAEALQQQMLKLLAPRVDRASHKIVNTNGPRPSGYRGRFPRLGS